MDAIICNNSVIVINIGMIVLIHDISDKYIDIAVIDKKVVFVFPSRLEVGSFPFSLEVQLMIAMIPSKMSMMMIGITNSPMFGINRPRANSLSVKGSNIFPSFDCRLYFRAINPSKASVSANMAATMKVMVMFVVKASGMMINGESSLDAVSRFGICL